MHVFNIDAYTPCTIRPFSQNRGREVKSLFSKISMEAFQAHVALQRRFQIIQSGELF